MILKTFEELHALVRGAEEIRTVALVRAEDEHSQEAVFQVERDGLLKAVFIGNRQAIHETAQSLGQTIDDERIYDAEDPVSAAALSVQLVREGKADFLMKGKLETGELLKAVVNKTDGLSEGGVMSHIAVNEIPSYHKLLVTTDGGMLPYPTLEQKKHIVENAAAALRALGYECPKVCVLTAVEKMNPKMPETMEAAALKEMNQTGHLDGCLVEGPISLDLALVKERSVVKGYESPCAGDADILVVPNIHAGNILGKTLVEMAGAKMAGMILGARCPIVLTSRGSSAEEKYNSLILACAVCGKERSADTWSVF